MWIYLLNILEGKWYIMLNTNMLDILRNLSYEDIDAGITKEGAVPQDVDPDEVFATRLILGLSE